MHILCAVTQCKNARAHSFFDLKSQYLSHDVVLIDGIAVTTIVSDPILIE